MPESEEYNKKKYKFIIYHGHIHVLTDHEDNEHLDKIYDKKNPKY